MSLFTRISVLGHTRANYTTIAGKLKCSPDTVARSAERLEKLQLADIREHQGPKDERERKYICIREERLKTIDTLEDIDHIIPKQGGNRYICSKCDSTDVAIKTVKTMHCNACHHEEIIQAPGLNEWIMQNGQKKQKQLAFESEAKSSSDEQNAQKQLAEHSVYTGVLLPLLRLMRKRRYTIALKSKLLLPLLPVMPDHFLSHPRFCEIDVSGAMDGLSGMRNGKSMIRFPISLVRMRSERVRRTLRPGAPMNTRAKFEQAQASVKPFDFLMFMCDGSFTFFDQDHCIDTETGEIDPQALERAHRLNSYTEISWSGTGFHTYAEGKLPKGGRKNTKLGVEMYDSGRACVYTGNVAPGFPLLTIESRPDEIAALHTELFPPTPEVIWRTESEQLAPVDEQDFSEEELQALLVTIRMKGCNARNGQKFTDLLQGDWQSYYSSPSEADLGLCRMLVYYGEITTVSTLDWVFRQSGLYREKWERDDYREKTLRRALFSAQGE